MWRGLGPSKTHPGESWLAAGRYRFIVEEFCHGKIRAAGSAEAS